MIHVTLKYKNEIYICLFFTFHKKKTKITWCSGFSISEYLSEIIKTFKRKIKAEVYKLYKPYQLIRYKYSEMICVYKLHVNIIHTMIMKYLSI